MSRNSRLSVAPVLTAVVVGVLAWGAPAGAAPIGFETPSVVDPIHAFGEPDVAIAPNGGVFASGPTGTGTQRSVWLGSPDGGHSFRVVSPGPPPSALQSFNAPPGGGDTELAFDSRGKQYFSDLYALTCFRQATTADAGATVNQSVYPAGCGGIPPADRQWFAVYDPPAGTPNQSAYTGPRPLIYQVYNSVANGGQWVKSNSTMDPQPGGPGLNFFNAEQDGPGTATGYGPLGADGYPAIDQVTGKVFQATTAQNADGTTFDLLLNIGTPNAAGDLKFLDAPPTPNPSANNGGADNSKLIHIADKLHGNTGVLFDVASMDRARNLWVVWTVDDPGNKSPASRQVWVSVASAATGWTKWTPPKQVSDGSTATGDAVNVMPWIQAGGPGRADAVWLGANKVADPSTAAGQSWNVFLGQIVYPTDATGAVTGAAPREELVKVSPHPMKYNDICLVGTDCIQQQGNRNLADFFQVRIDRSGAAEVVYADTSNGLVQPGFTPANQQLVDHAGAALVMLARQSSGPGLLGHDVSGPSSAPTDNLSHPAGQAKYPVIGGTEVPGLDVLSTNVQLTAGTLTLTESVVDLAHPSSTAAAITGTQFLHYVTRWQMGNTIYYAAMQNTSANSPTYYAGAAASIDLCSVSACDPHVLTYPEPGSGGQPEHGSVSCPRSPSAASPCTLTISIRAADVGSPSSASLLEGIGSYAFASSHQQGMTTNAQAQGDNVPLEVGGLCCFNFRAATVGTLPPLAVAPQTLGLRGPGRRARACVSRRHFTIHILRRDLRSVAIYLGHRRLRVLRGPRLHSVVNLRGLPRGRFTLRILAIRRDGRRLKTSRTYRTCAPRQRRNHRTQRRRHRPRPGSLRG